MAVQRPWLEAVGTALVVAAVLVAGIGILLGVAAIAADETSNGLQVMGASIVLAGLLGAGGWYLRRRGRPLP